jgi:hypothetical protein
MGNHNKPTPIPPNPVPTPNPTWNCFVNVEPQYAVAVISLEDGLTHYASSGLQRLVFTIDSWVVSGWGCNLTIVADGYDTYSARLPLPERNGYFPDVQLVKSKPQYPPTPSRMEVLGVNMHFRGGLIVDSPTFGKMPWYPAALSWCDEETRKAAYRVMHEAGDTHAIIQIPNGLPLYDEPGQFYTSDKFPAKDWTNGETDLVNSPFPGLVDEVIREGFKFMIGMDERMENSKRIVKLVMNALTDKQLEYGFTFPGYDGVFYGWEPVTHIIEWASMARAIKPSCYLGMEFNVGHIPLGEGGGDYYHGGRMDGYDVILAEFNSFHPGQTDNMDQVWQIVGRCIKPYHRPPEQPADDDPNPPFYLIDSPRGPRAFCAFESDMPYGWVRTNVNDPNAVAAALAQINYETDYFRRLGCQFIG